MSERFDVIIFGASGYTGKRIVRVFSEILLKEKRKLKWTVAARSEIKMKSVLEELKETTGAIPLDLPLITADTQNASSLSAMTVKARLLINCTGPSKTCGLPVIRACVQNNCHYIDVTAEPHFMEEAHRQFNSEALKRKVYVVLACGMESILADIGVNFLQREFDGTLNSVECYLEVLQDNDRFIAGSLLTPTSWRTHIHVLSDFRSKITEKQNYGLELEPKLRLRRLPHKVPKSKNRAVPFPCADATVMRMSQHHFFKIRQSRPVQIQTYVAFSNLFHTLLVSLGFFFLYFLTTFNYLTKLLLKYPRFFSSGFCGDDPLETETKKMKIVMTHHGRGWKNKKVNEFYKGPEDGVIVSKVSARDAYYITGVASVCSALVVLEAQGVPLNGGVYTPGVFFENTRIIESLGDSGVDFQLVFR